jgi:hypothetical protein
MNESIQLKNDLFRLIRHAQNVASYVDEEVDEALLASREQRLDPDESIRLQSRVLAVMRKGSSGGRPTSKRPAQASPAARIRRSLSLRPRLPRMPALLAGATIVSRHRGLAFVGVTVLLTPILGYAASGLRPNVGGQLSHVVIVMKENHSADNLFRKLPAAINHSGLSASKGAIDAGRMTGFGLGPGDDAPDTASPNHLVTVSGASSDTTPNPSSVDSNVIRIDRLMILVKPKTAASFATQVSNFASDVGGTTVSQTRSGGGSNVTITITVPQSTFRSTLRRIYPLGKKVESENLTTENVGLEETNLGAQLRNYQGQRLVLLALFNKATNVAATIHVQQVLSSVQSQIDQLQAQIRYLGTQTATSKITVAFVTTHPKPVVVKHTPAKNGPVAKAFSDAGAAATNVFTGLIVLLGYALPVAVVALILFGIYAVIRRRVRSRIV